MQQLAFWTQREHTVNVASAPQRSPFRYPGGKTWLIPYIRQWLTSKPTAPMTPGVFEERAAQWRQSPFGREELPSSGLSYRARNGQRT